MDYIWIAIILVATSVGAIPLLIKRKKKSDINLDEFK